MAAGRRFFSNNFKRTLDGGINDTTQTIVVDSTIASALSDLSIGTSVGSPTYQSYYCHLTIYDNAGNYEIIKVVKRNADGVTIYGYRGAEGTTAQSWADGSDIAMFATAEGLKGRDQIISELTTLDPPNSSTIDADDVLFGVKMLPAGAGPDAFKQFPVTAVTDYYNTLSDVSTAAWVNDTDDTLAVSDSLIPTNEMVKAYVDASSGGSVNSFSTIAVSGQSNVVADSSTDTLTLAAGSNITITTNAGTDTVTISASGGGGSQTPWASNIDTAGYSLTNSSTSGGVTVTTGNTLTLEGAPVSLISTTEVQVKGGTTTATGLALYEGSSNGSAKITIKAPNDLTGASYTLTLPQDDGSNGQFLQTDGSGGLTWSAPVVADGDKGDITVSSSGTVWTVDNDAISYAKIQDVSASQRLLGRDTAGAGNIEELTAATVKTMLSLNNVENTALSTWAGSSNITTVGTVTSGTINTTLNSSRVLDGLDGATISTATIATDDKVLIRDTSASDATKTVTTQAIRDLVPGSGTLTSAQLAASLTDETGSGAAVFATSPTLVTPVLGTPSSVTLTNATGLPATTGLINLNIMPQGRLTLATGVPVMTSDQSAKTTIYYTPYLGNLVPLYDGTNFKLSSFSEISVATTDTAKNPAAIGASKVNDWFVWNDSGTLRISHGPDWTNDTTRSAGTALTMVNGIYLNNSSITNGPAASRGTYVGTTRSNSSSQLDWILGGSGAGGSPASLFVWNAYNRVVVGNSIIDSSASHNYTTAAWRAWNNGTTMRATYVVGLSEDIIKSNFTTHCTTTSNAVQMGTGLGVDSTTTVSGSTGSTYFNTVNFNLISSTATYAGYPGLGVHYVAGLEWGNTNATQYGSSNAAVTGMTYELRM